MLSKDKRDFFALYNITLIFFLQSLKSMNKRQNGEEASFGRYFPAGANCSVLAGVDSITYTSTSNDLNQRNCSLDFQLGGGGEAKFPVIFFLWI